MGSDRKRCSPNTVHGTGLGRFAVSFVLLVSGVTQHFPDTIRPALQIVRMREGLHHVSGATP